MEVVSITENHVERLAEFAAGIHGRSDGGPSSRLADTEWMQAALGGSFRAGPAVVAFDGASVIGYLIAPLPSSPGPGDSRLTPAHWAVRDDGCRSICRSLYKAVAHHLVAAGCTYHSIPIPAHSPAALQAFVELEFGIDHVKGVAPVRAASNPDGRIRRATDIDLDRLLDLTIELQKFHSRPPMFQPALLDVPWIRDSLARSIVDDDAVVLVVDGEDGPIGFLQAEPDNLLHNTVSIGINIVRESMRGRGIGTAMLTHLLSWANERGVAYCSVGWSSTNPVSDPFYRARGFRPYRYRLHRRIDPRVAWANEALDYTAFPPA